MRWLPLSGAAAALIVTGCAPFCFGVPCPSCPPPIHLRITDGPITDLSASIPALQLTASCTETECTFLDDGEPGDFEVVLSGAGIESQVVRVTVPEASDFGCCSCGYATAEMDVTLRSR